MVQTAIRAGFLAPAGRPGQCELCRRPAAAGSQLCAECGEQFCAVNGWPRSVATLVCVPCRVCGGLVADGTICRECRAGVAEILSTFRRVRRPVKWLERIACALAVIGVEWWLLWEYRGFLLDWVRMIFGGAQ